MTARFWVYYPPADGNVRLEVSPGSPLTISWGGPTDEGWSYEWETFRVIGDTLHRESLSEGRDCDGTLSTWTECECRIDRLDHHEALGGFFPAWERVDGGQRDEYAEAEGY